MSIDAGHIGAGWVNLMELGTVSVSSSAAGYPEYRLYDRYFRRMWKAAAAGDQSVVLHMGVQLTQFDSLVIPAGHNLAFNGSIFWEYSTDGIVYHDLVSNWSQVNNNLILKQIDIPIAYAYLRVRFVNTVVPAEVPEIFITQIRQFPKPVQGAVWGKQYNAGRNEPKSRTVQFVNKGEPQRYRDYPMGNINPSDLPWFRQWDEGFGGCRPFIVIDHLGERYFAELISTGDGRFISFEETEYGQSATVRLIEVLG